MSKRYVVGIDPGKSTGLAVYDRCRRGIVYASTLDFWGAYDLLSERYGAGFVSKVVIEVPETKRVFHRGAASRGAIERTSVNVGGVIRESELLAEGLERLGHNVVRQPPYGKVTAGVLKRLTGYEGRTNPHVRDAIMLCYGL